MPRSWAWKAAPQGFYSPVKLGLGFVAQRRRGLERVRVQGFSVLILGDRTYGEPSETDRKVAFS